RSNWGARTATSAFASWGESTEHLWFASIGEIRVRLPALIGVHPWLKIRLRTWLSELRSAGFFAQSSSKESGRMINNICGHQSEQRRARGCATVRALLFAGAD